MRVYLSLHPADLAASAFSPATAWAVTPALEASVGTESWTEEDYEAYALDLAAEACVEGLEDTEPACRVVAAADVPAVRWGHRAGLVLLDEPVSLDQVVSFHIDEEDTWPLVARAAEGEDDDDELSEAALLWYDVSEVALVREILGVDA